VTIIVQEQGKKRGTVIVPAGADETAVLLVIEKDAKLAPLAAGKQYKFVPDRIINFY
jgi:IS5 family transposase